MSHTHDERHFVELPLIAQLTALGWQHLEGDVFVPDLTERANFGEVLLETRLRDAIRRINVDEDGKPWLDAERVQRAAGALTRLGHHKLMEANEAATDLLLRGTPVEGDPERHGVRSVTARFIDFDHIENNDFLVVNQFRVDVPGLPNYIIPDLVLFINGVPVVVVECKAPSITNPMGAGITQLLRYTNQRGDVDEEEGVEKLFHYNQLLISTFFHGARVGTIGASYEHYQEWKDTAPTPAQEVAAAMGVDTLSSQQMLAAGMLTPATLLDLLRNFLLFSQADGRTVKIVARYHQYRAVHEAVQRLERGQTRVQHGETDQRGGIIWHTQGSGKSLTLVFLVRKMRRRPDLRRFKVVVVTDRTDLEKQLKETAQLSGENVRVAGSRAALQTMLSDPGADLVFSMIQKYTDQEDAADPLAPRDTLYPELNSSDEIVCLVDEAHRSHTSDLHANLHRALPNSAMIGFTGTPILMGEQKRTRAIFGPYIDRPYTIRQAEQDGATVRILYEGYGVEAAITDGQTLDSLADALFSHLSPEERSQITAKYVRPDTVQEAVNLIAAKADHILRHYVDTILPNGFKAQVVAVSRRAAVRFQQSLVAAQRRLVSELDDLPASLVALSESEREALPDNIQHLVRAAPYRDTIAGLEFAAVISGGGQNDPKSWASWTDGVRQEGYVRRFKKPLRTAGADAAKTDPLAILVVKSMLLTGFDAPNEQALYLDRKMDGAELLQAIARVNRTASGKSHGLVVDYQNIMGRLREALAVYSAEDIAGIEGGIASIKDTLPVLADRHRRVLAVFTERGVARIGDVNACVTLLADVRTRADFSVKLATFLESLDEVLPRPEALAYVPDARTLGLINQMARNLYRDEQLTVVGAGQKVRDLIDEHVLAVGINPRVPPISILDTAFEKAVARHTEPRTQASEMEHAARYHITHHFNEDPAYYKKLSERLEEILTTWGENWDALVAALKLFSAEVREGRGQDDSGLDPRTQAPFLGVLLEEAGADGRAEEDLRRYTQATVELVEIIRAKIREVGFWRSDHAQRVLLGRIAAFLDDHDLIALADQEKVADKLLALARALHAKLVTA